MCARVCGLAYSCVISRVRVFMRARVFSDELSCVFVPACSRT